MFVKEHLWLNYLTSIMETSQGFTITIGNRCENGVGMQIISGGADNLEKNRSLVSVASLRKIKNKLEEDGFSCRYVDMSLEEGNDILEEAGVLIIYDFLTKEQRRALENSLLEMDWDKKAYSRGRVVNKRARWNLCFADKAQEPDYENKKGRVIPWDECPRVKDIVDRAGDILGAEDLVAEGNYYYDWKKCYIGFHGDTEREIVFGVRIGVSYPLQFEWYLDSKRIGKNITIELPPGSAYIMSTKAVGTDWRRRKIPTLRHAVLPKETNYPLSDNPN